MSEVTALFDDGSVLGAIFFGGVIGNFTALCLQHSGQCEDAPFLMKISVMAQGLAGGGHGREP